MEYQFQFHDSSRHVSVTASGVGRVHAFESLFAELIESPQFEKGMRILLDLTRVDMTTVPGFDMPQIGRGLEQVRQRCDGCSLAIVSDDPLTRGLVEMAHLETSSGFDVFRALTRDEAVAWLELQETLANAPPVTQQ